jgi:hypothetical protein
VLYREDWLVPDAETTWDPEHPDGHALLAGAVAAYLWSKGVDGQPEVDAEGNYTPRFIIQDDGLDEFVRTFLRDPESITISIVIETPYPSRS